MNLETIYQELSNINNTLQVQSIKDLLTKIEQQIRLETSYKTTPRTRVNAIKRIASHSDARPALTGYGIQDNYKVVTDSYHLIAIHQDNMPLKLVTTDTTLIDTYGKQNCIIANYPNVSHILDFDHSQYNTISLDYDDIMSFYKMNKKAATTNLYNINDQQYNITYLKNIIDVLGTNNTIYQLKDHPLYIINEDNEIGLVLPIKTY